MVWKVQGQGSSSLSTRLCDVHQICLFHRLWATPTKLKRIDGNHNGSWQAEAELGLLADTEHISSDKSKQERGFYFLLVLPLGTMKAAAAEVRHKSRTHLKDFVMTRGLKSLSIYSLFMYCRFGRNVEE